MPSIVFCGESAADREDKNHKRDKENYMYFFLKKNDKIPLLLDLKRLVALNLCYFPIITLELQDLII